MYDWIIESLFNGRLPKTTQNVKSVEELADAKALGTRLEEQLKQTERQSKPVGLYVVLAVLMAIMLFLISN